MSNSDFPRMRYSDVVETEVLDASGGFPTPPNVVIAEATVEAQTSSINIQGCKQLDVFVELEEGVTATILYIKVRFSGKDAPDVSVPADWACIQVDNIDPATGQSNTQDYLIAINLAQVNGPAAPGAAAIYPRRFVSRIQQISGRHASALVWVAGGAAAGKVYFMRQGGSM